MNRKLLMASGAVAMALLVSGCDQARSQTTQAQPVSTYTVQDGDTLYDLTAIAKGDPELWREVVKQNPFLAESGRQFTKPDGTFVVVIRGGEQLRGLEELGINIPGKVATAIGKATFTGGQPATKPEPTWFERNWSWLIPFIGSLALIVLYGGYFLWQQYTRYRDPVSSGPAMVRGGVTDETVALTLTERGQNQARRFTIVGEIVRGKGYGEMMVAYRGGREERRLLDGQTVYRATVRFEGEAEDQVIYTLQGCGNDIRAGNRNVPGREFRFEPETLVHQAPEPTPEPEAVAPAPAPVPEPVEEPAPVVAPVATDIDRQPNLTIELRPADKPDGTAMVRVKGAATKDMAVTIYDDEVTVRFIPKG